MATRWQGTGLERMAINEIAVGHVGAGKVAQAAEMRGTPVRSADNFQRAASCRHLAEQVCVTRGSGAPCDFVVAMMLSTSKCINARCRPAALVSCTMAASAAFAVRQLPENVGFACLQAVSLACLSVKIMRTQPALFRHTKRQSAKLLLLLRSSTQIFHQRIIGRPRRRAHCSRTSSWLLLYCVMRLQGRSFLRMKH